MDPGKPLNFVNLTTALKGMRQYGNGGKKATFVLRAAGMLGFVAAVLSLGIAPHIFPERDALLIIYRIALAVELTCVLLVVWSGIQELPRFKDPKNDYEKGLDHDFVQYVDMMCWLGSQPTSLLVEHARYARLRRDSMTQRLPFLVGSSQLVSVIPVAAVLYVQAKSLSTGGQMTMVEWLATIAFTTLLGLSWSLIRQLMRLETYCALLDDAVQARS